MVNHPTEPLTEAQQSSVIGSLKSVNETLAFLVALAPRERKRLQKMGQQTRAFVEDALEAGIRNPGLLPRALDPDEMRDRLDLADQLREINATVAQLHERLSDTLILVGSSLFEDARLVYKLTRTKVGKDEGLKAATETLSKRFAAQGRPKKKQVITALAA